MDLTVVAYATLGLSLFVSAIKVGSWILNTDPRAIIHAGRWALLALAALALAALAWLIESGRWTSAMLLAAFMLPIFVQAAPRWRLILGPLNVMRNGYSDLGAGVAPPTRREAPDAQLVRQSIAVLRAYLEQTGQQIEHKRADMHVGSPGNGRMSTNEALDVLGLAPGSSAGEVRQAHRRLAQMVDPQLGGSRYLITKVNEARDVLLGE